MSIAVTGRPGSGKSTIINTLRGLNPRQSGAAPVGVTETTSMPTRYPHPQYTNFVLWDLPGVGTPRYPRDTYLRAINFSTYDFFFIVTSDRFTEDDSWLAREIRSLGKALYFIRSKLDADIANDRVDNEDDHSEDAVINQIRENCRVNMQGQNIAGRLFVLSGRRQFESRWDFPHLLTTIVADLPEIQRHAFTLYTMANSKEMIEMKYKELKKRVLKVATLSAGLSAIPVPGLGLAVDVGILVNEITTYLQQFRLDQESLDELHARYSVTLDQTGEIFLKYLLPRTLARELPAFVLSLLAKFSTGMVAEEVAKMIPVLIPVAAAISFETTRLALNSVLVQLRDASIDMLNLRIEASRRQMGF